MRALRKRERQGEKEGIGKKRSEQDVEGEEERKAKIQGKRVQRKGGHFKKLKRQDLC